MTIQKHSTGSFLVNLALLSVCIVILAGVSVPALKHKNKRENYREITSTALSITNTIEKCLGLERDSMLCDTPEKLIPHGYSTADIELNLLISEVSIELENDQYRIFFKPPEKNQKATFLLPSHDYIREAMVVDRNKRPVIESWQTSPHSGCLKQGFCD